MQRGIITLTREEQALLTTILSTTTLKSSMIFSRLSAAHSNDQPDERVELSREEAEYVLDQLPIPSSQEPETLTLSRHKFTTFIQNL